MAIVRIQMPFVNRDPASAGRPRQCPKCSSEILQRWGKVSKPLRDTELDQVEVYRYRCTEAECRHTFRHYPEGVDRADLSKRLRCLAALAWGMGLSLRGVGTIFSAFWRRVRHRQEQRVESSTGEGRGIAPPSQSHTGQT